MSAETHLVIAVREPLWPALESLLHWQRQPGGIRHLFLYHTDDPGASREPARRLERFAREHLPGTETHRREGGAEPRHLRRQLDAWQRDAAEGPWILDLTGGSSLLTWGAETWFGRPDCRAVVRDASRVWHELRRDPEGDVGTTALVDFRRDTTDSLTPAEIVRALWSEGPAESDLKFTPDPVAALPVVPLTEAALRAGWRWTEAFRVAGVEAGATSENDLFARYLGALLLALGPRNVTAVRAADGERPAGNDAIAEFWVNHGGRIVVLEARLGENEDETAITGRLERAARVRANLSGAPIEWQLIRPARRFSPAEVALARAHGVGLLDQSDCHTLPSRLAALFALPLSAEGVEIERLLQTHLTRTGRTRVFTDEPAVLQAVTETRDDPLWARADVWLEQVMRGRGQNWLLSAHRGRAFLRVPSDGRPAALQEWRLLVVHTSGLDEREVTARPDAKGGAVVVEFPESPGPGRRVAAWLQPFLNRPVTFAEAQMRFATQARVEAEAANAAGHANRPPAPPAAATPPSTGGPRNQPRPPQPPRRPEPGNARPKPSPEPRPKRNPLADLDRALDDALGG